MMFGGNECFVVVWELFYIEEFCDCDQQEGYLVEGGIGLGVCGCYCVVIVDWFLLVLDVVLLVSVVDVGNLVCVSLVSSMCV